MGHLKHDTLEAAQEYTGERPMSRIGFASGVTLEKIEKMGVNRLAVRSICRVALLRGNKERYVKSLAENVKVLIDANDP